MEIESTTLLMARVGNCLSRVFLRRGAEYVRLTPKRSLNQHQVSWVERRMRLRCSWTEHLRFSVRICWWGGLSCFQALEREVLNFQRHKYSRKSNTKHASSARGPSVSRVPNVEQYLKEGKVSCLSGFAATRVIVFVCCLRLFM